MGKDKEIKLNFKLTNVSEFYRWVQELPILLSKCKLPPRTLKMTNAQFTDYFNAGDDDQKWAFIEKINQCTGFVGDSITDSSAKKAFHVQHIAERNTLLQQAKMLRECVNALKSIVTPAQTEVMRKVEMSKFQYMVSTEPTEPYYLNNLFTEYDDYRELLESLSQQNMSDNEKRMWLIDNMFLKS